jgi:hypothetical protein
MRTRAALLLLISVTACAKSTVPPQPPRQRAHLVDPRPQKRGRWHMAEDGQVVFCYGPVVTHERAAR